MGAEQSSHEGGHSTKSGGMSSLFPDPLSVHAAHYQAHPSRDGTGGGRSVSTLQRERDRRPAPQEETQATTAQRSHSTLRQRDHPTTQAPREEEREEGEEEEEELPREVGGVPIIVRVRPRRQRPHGIVELTHDDQHIRINFDKLPEIQEAEPPPPTAEELAALEEERNRVASPVYYGRQAYMDRCSPTSPNLKRFDSFVSHHVFFHSGASEASAGSFDGFSFSGRSPMKGPRRRGELSPDSPSGFVKLTHPNFEDYAHSVASSSVSEHLNYYHESSSGQGSGAATPPRRPPRESQREMDRSMSWVDDLGGAAHVDPTGSPPRAPLLDLPPRKKPKRSTNVNDSAVDNPNPSRASHTPPNLNEKKTKRGGQAKKESELKNSKTKSSVQNDDKWSSTSDEFFEDSDMDL
ncbi:hypothetical protein AGDE_15832 [Angomonas deanei]|uniref:Uncharacterized protein n=1 Tax=Angomonas deanei TaxID=59799 RepID=A0A7G2C210_9TRYP|nr:hypothetical protein AGDE_15832 [Angomonas deanei]CAD2213689.1 hypothetical protein, conserved [Angomonas deanei]|eukprot:EPY18290.1 hypothetical protein AGDE_15832 [Angomonas deanei]